MIDYAPTISESNTAPYCAAAYVQPMLEGPRVSSGGQVPISVAWSSVFRTLNEWFADPERLREEELEPPSRSVLEIARLVAAELDRAHMPPPTQVVPDGDGGLSFEMRIDAHFESLSVRRNSVLEHDVFIGGKLIFHRLQPFVRSHWTRGA